MTRQSTKDPDVLLFKPSVNNNNNIIQPRKYETKNKKSKKRQNSSASRRSSVSTELHSNVLKMKGGFIKGQCVNFLTNTGKWKYGRLQDIDSILGRGKVIYIDGRLREVWVCTTHLKLISQQNEMSVNIGDVVLAYRQSSKAMIPGVVLHYNQLKEQMCIKFYDGLIEDNVHYRIIQNLDGIELGNVIVETSLESLQLIRSTECDIHKEKSPAKLSINASTESDTANKEYNFESFVFKPLVKSMKTPRKSKCKTSSLILSGLKENKHAFNHPSQECHQDIITSPPYVLDESKQMDSQNSHHTDSIGSEIHISKQPSPTRTISVYSSNSSLNNNETEKRVEEANCIESVEITPVTDTDEIIVVDSDVVSPNDGSCVPSRIADDQEFLSSHEHVDAVECSPTTNSIPRINSIQISTNKRRRFSRGRFIPVARRKKRPREAMVNNEVVESAVDNSNSSSDRSTVVDQSLLVSPKCKKIKIIDGVSDENLAKDQQHFDIFKHIVEINSEQLEIPSTYKMFFDTTKQTERSTFECPFVECGRVFGREDLLNTHIQYCHDHAIEEERVITVPIDCNSVQAISIQSTRNDFLPTPYIVVHCSCGDKTMTEDMLQVSLYN
ncbi:hypothetical protein GJ496_000509 [Pomphorhynchus laevis]|nr:hypothetical protein GJ496_000509 [Pomphorhynchus laevis]